MNKEKIQRHINDLRENLRMLDKRIESLEYEKAHIDYGSAMFNDVQVWMPLENAKTERKNLGSELKAWEGIVEE